MIYLLRQAFADMLRVTQAMPNVVLVAFTSTLGVNALQIALSGTSVLLMAAINIVGALLLSLYFIAVHRFVILGEKAAHFPFSVGTRGWRFFFNGMLLGLVSLIPLVFVAPLVVAFKYAGIMSLWPWLLVAAAVVALVSTLLLTVRLVIVLPAIAIGAPGAGWGNAYRDTRGYALRLFLTYVLAMLLVGLVTTIAFVVFFFVCELTSLLTARSALVVTNG